MERQGTREPVEMTPQDLHLRAAPCALNLDVQFSLQPFQKTLEPVEINFGTVVVLRVIRAGSLPTLERHLVDTVLFVQGCLGARPRNPC